MTHHTQGPWKVGEPSLGWFKVYAHNNRTVAKLPFTAGRADDNEANARLIASSPTLYEFVAGLAKNGDKLAQSTLDLLKLSY